MRSLSTGAAFAIAGVLALLLILYVFAGGGGSKRDDAPHCVPSAALNQVKDELFRRAAAVRGTADPLFANVARSSAVRAASRISRKHSNGSNEVTCSGAIAIDLPPGAPAAGGRRSLSANLVYRLASAQAGGVRLVSLSNADAIIGALAAIGRTGTGQQQVGAPESQQPGEIPLPPAGPQADQRPDILDAVPPPPAPAVRAAPPVSTPPAAPRSRAVRPTSPPRQSNVPQRKLAKPAPTPSVAAREEPAAPVEPPQTRSPPPAPAPVVAVRPSFNCRYARARSEVAVCSNPGLASLDRQMSAQFFSALSVARPGQRAMLQRSRNRFLAARNACGSEACIAQTYRARIAEIRRIMDSGF